MHFKLTRDENTINMVKRAYNLPNGDEDPNSPLVNTTFRRGTKGWSYYENWLKEGNVAEEHITPEDQLREDIASAKRAMINTDLDLSRILEDLIDILHSKGVVLTSEFPEESKEKIDNKKTKRAALTALQ
jgi:hypothetical protein